MVIFRIWSLPLIRPPQFRGSDKKISLTRGMLVTGVRVTI